MEPQCPDHPGIQALTATAAGGAQPQATYEYSQRSSRSQHLLAPPTPPYSPLTLKFNSHEQEQGFLQYQSATLAKVAKFGAWLYLFMDLPGFITIVAAATVRPELWSSSAVAGCKAMTMTTTAVLLAHLLLLMTLPAATYQPLRGRIVAAVRVLYMASAMFNGLQQCRTVTSWVAGVELESPVSAFLWRTGIIALLWLGGAFQLPFWEHFFLQSVATMAYSLFLADSVCSSLDTVEHVHTTLAVARQVLSMLQQAWFFIAFLFTGHERVLHEFWAPAHNSLPAAPAQLQDSCVLTVQCAQVVLGHVLPSTVLYFRERADRKRWWQKRYVDLQEQAAPSVRQRQPREQRTQGPLRCRSMVRMAQFLASLY